MRSPLGALFGAFNNKAPIDLSSTTSFGIRSSGITPTPNMTSELQAMEYSSTLFSIVDKIATSQASVKRDLYRKAASGKEEERELINAHPALSVLRKPNDFYTESELIYAITQHFALTGERWLVVGRSKLLNSQGPPIELWPVRPDRMRPVVDPEKFIVGYIYKSGHDEVPLELNQVIYTRRPHPSNPFRGISPVASLIVDLDAERASAIYNAMFFRNGAEPGGLIETGGKELSDGQFKKLLLRWREQHQGVDNAHRVGILEHGKWVERKISQRDMQFSELRRFNQETVRRAFTFPKPILGDVDDVNRANSEAAAEMFAQWLIVPDANSLNDTFNHKFLPLFGKGMEKAYEFDYTDPAPPNREEDREDKNAAVDRAEKLIGMGFDRDEVLEHEGLPLLTYNPTTPVENSEKQETEPGPVENIQNGHSRDGRPKELRKLENV